MEAYKKVSVKKHDKEERLITTHISMCYQGYESRPYGTAVRVISHCTEWATIHIHIDKYTAATQKTKGFGKPGKLWPVWVQSRGTWREPSLLPAFA
ncbi:hypothetical protein TNCV_1956231 [Trichonephila clavipes]|nr:hypothetical protein TNCV_1956231 [Trichonephila clavipes]